MDNKTLFIGLHNFNLILIKADFQIKINNPLSLQCKEQRT